MSWTAVAIGGGTIISGLMGGSASRSAAAQQAAAANQAAQLQYKATEDSLAQQKSFYDQNQANQRPYMQAGSTAMGSLANLMGTSGNTGAANYGSLMKPFDNSALALTQDPSYQFQLNQGMQALQASDLAKGTLMSGQGAKDIANYSQGLASTNYQNAYQNYVTNQTNQYNRLSGIAGLGQSAAAGVGNAGVQTGANMANTALSGANMVGNSYMQAGNANASGTMGQANAYSNAIGSGVNNYLTSQYINRMYPNQTATTQAPSSTLPLGMTQNPNNGSGYNSAFGMPATQVTQAP
jgi:hypothetical protein